MILLPVDSPARQEILSVSLYTLYFNLHWGRLGEQRIKTAQHYQAH